MRLTSIDTTPHLFDVRMTETLTRPDVSLEDISELFDNLRIFEYIDTGRGSGYHLIPHLVRQTHILLY